MNLVNEIIAVKSGTFFRVGYKSECPVKAEYKKQGIKVSKFVETTVRTGVKYTHIKGVELASDGEQKKSPYSWIVPNKIKAHETNGCEYLVVATVNKNHRTKSKYVVTINGVDTIVDKNEVKEYLINSYFNDNKKSSPVRTIKLTNILSFNGQAVEI